MRSFNLTVNKIVRYVFIVICFFIFIARTCNYLSYFISNTLLMLLAFLFLVMSIYFSFKYKDKLINLVKKIFNKVDLLSYKKMVIILITVSLVTKLLFLILFQVDSTKHSDISMYWSFIKQLSTDGFILENADYARSWPHTVMMSLFYTLTAKLIGTSNIYLYVVFNIIMLTFSSYLIFSTISYLKGKNIAFISALLWIIIPVGIMQPLMLIHENTLIFIHSLVFFLYFKVVLSTKNKICRYLVLVSIFVILAFESLINQFALVAIIGLLIDFVFKNYKLIIKVMLIVITLLSILIAHNFENNYIDSHVAKTDIDHSLTITYGWTFYLGMNYETGGLYSDSDSVEWNKYNLTNDENLIINHEKELISERISEYLANPVRIIKHLNDKMRIIWSDYNPIGYRGKDGKCFGNELCQKFNDSKLDTIIYIIMAYINLLISFLMFMLCIKTRKEIDDDYICYSKMFIIGVNIILLFIEVMSKYSSHMVMIYLWIFAYLLLKNNIKSNKINYL